tara:strand:- start:1011 stop:1802 length:792 start_codon:yes stop_codon:yes gene_type:complete
MQLSKANTIQHSDFRNWITATRRQEVFEDMRPAERLAFTAECLTHFGITYGAGDKDSIGGSFYLFGSERGAATWKRNLRNWKNERPGLECAGFVECAMYAAGLIDGSMLNYRGLRQVPRNIKLYREAAGVQKYYTVNWIPTETRTTITQDAGLTGPWPSVVQLMFFREEFEPIANGVYPHVGDLVFFLYKDTKGWHVHVGIWAAIDGEDGLIHSSPFWKDYSSFSGPKFTRISDKYYRNYLEPQRKTWGEWFGASVVRLRGKA